MSFSDNKRIAKNTLMLYLRMFLLMAISLYTYRVILKELGIDDYGLYNVIGGIITVFSFVSSALVASTQRYFNVALGKGDDEQYKKIYSMSINIFILFSFVIFVLGETIGIWFIENQLNIPSGREISASWVFQLSLITVLITLLRTSDNASIIAYERMSFYAYISIGEALLKLVIVFLLQVSSGDKLVLYVILYLITTIIINVTYKWYCNSQFDNCRFHITWDKGLFKDLLKFTGWGVLSNGTNVVVLQTENVLINQYFSVAVNAARGTASQVYNAVNLFLINFQTAFKPQLTKTYAAGEMQEHYNLIYKSSKFSFYLMLLLVIPISFNLTPILGLWLVEVPPYTVEFTIYILYCYLIDSIGAPLSISVFANGRIRNLQIASCILYILKLIFAFIVFYYGTVPYIVSISTMVSHLILLFIYMYYSKKCSNVDLSVFFHKVLVPISLVFVTSSIIPFILYHYCSYFNFIYTVLICFVEMVWVCLMILFFGLTKGERDFLLDFVNKKLRHRF